MRKKILLIGILLPVFWISPPKLFGIESKIPVPISTTEEAVRLIDSIKTVPASRFWINVQPDQFVYNLRNLVISPLLYYEERGTNFCAYSAMSFLPIDKDPLGFCRFMFDMYEQGEALFYKIQFKPHRTVYPIAGTIKNRGALDINSAAQLWFLCLADRFKGYLNLFNRKFSRGDDNRLWAATDFSKFNRILKKLTSMQIRSRGSDIFRLKLNDPYNYLKGELERGFVFLYVNYWGLKPRKTYPGLINTPTHFMWLIDIEEVDRHTINLVYWGHGKKTLYQLSYSRLRKILFGITVCEKKNE